MFQFATVETFVDAPINMISWIGDFVVTELGGNRILLAATRSGGGVLALDIDAGMVVVDQITFSVNSALPAPPTLDILTVGGQPRLIVSGSNQSSLLTYRLGASDILGGAVKPAGGPAGVITAQEVLEIGGQTYIYAAMANNGGIRAYAMASGGGLTLVQDFQLSPNVQGVVTGELLHLTVGGVRFLAAIQPGLDRIVLIEIGAGGQLSLRGSIGAAEGLGLNGPAAMTVEVVHGVTYLTVAAAGSSSLSVIEVAADGGMVVRDHVVDTLATRLQGVQALESFGMGGRSFIVAGGGDGGLELLEMLPGGRLVRLAQLLDTPDTAMDGISAITATVIGTTVELFVAGETAGISRLTLDLSGLGQVLTGGHGDDLVSGGALDDLITGGAGDDLLSGGAGDDVLYDGMGHDTLAGGAGADLFILVADGNADTIREFQSGIDRLDLSAWGRIHDLSQVSIQSVTGGAVLSFGDEIVTILSANGLPLTRAHLAEAGAFDIWHALSSVQLVDGVFVGTSQDEYIEGTAADDMFLVSGGRDVIDGLDGTDLLDFRAMQQGAVVDMAAGSARVGTGQGPQFRSIEVIAGTDLGDTLYGAALGDSLGGNAGHDLLYGRAGNDTLAGDAGDDSLHGGAGADHFIGGEGSDLVFYWNAQSGLRVDMASAWGTSGEAAGDTFDGIERVAAGLFDDQILGNAAGNHLIGLDGRDLLMGRAGNDTLQGDGGNDTLSGGAGADVLYGGAGWDLVYYWDTPDGVRADLLTPVATWGEAQGDLFSSVEALAGSLHADQLLGNHEANRLDGLSGADVLYGRGGADTLFGGDGNDSISGGAGADWIHGGDGVDLVFYWDAAAGVRADLLTPVATYGDAQGDLFAAIEALAGSLHADQLLGSHEANRLDGLSGADVLYGRGGNDTILGGDGNDSLSGGMGADWINGGAGFDMVFYWDAATGVRADLSSPVGSFGDATGDVFSDVEMVVGSFHADQLLGNDAGNRLDGLSGNDYLCGRHGNDSLLGGDGADTLQGDGGDDVYWGQGGADTFVFHAGLDVIADFELGRDTLQLDDAAWGSDGRSVQDILDAAVVDAANAVIYLEFATGNRLVVHGVTQADQLIGHLTIF